MVKRYDENTEAFGCLIDVMVESDNGDYVLASDFDRMRRRNLAKRCLDRAKLRQVQSVFWQGLNLRTDADRAWNAWSKFYHLSIAIERGEPLEYFRKLGSD